MNGNIVIILIMLFVINYPVYRLLFRWFFYDEDEFAESVTYSFTPNFISFFRGEYWKDKFSTMKLRVYTIACIAVVVLELIIVTKIIEWFS